MKAPLRLLQVHPFSADEEGMLIEEFELLDRVKFQVTFHTFKYGRGVVF